MQSQMTIGNKLFLCFGGALALTLMISAVALQSFSSLGGQVRKLVGVNNRKLFLAGDMNNAIAEVISVERGIMLRAYMNDFATVEKYKSEQVGTFARLKRDTDEFVPLIETEEARRLIAQIQDTQSTIMQYHAEMTALVDKHDLDGATKVFRDKVLPTAKRVDDSAEELMTRINKLTMAVGTEVEASVSRSSWITVLMAAVSLLVGIVVVFVVRRINQILRRAVVQLSQDAAVTATAASQVSSASQSLAQGASEQAASLEETSASSEEISSMARRNSDNSHSAADLVTQSQHKFAETNQSLDQMVAAMGAINESSDKISKIIKTIDEIAFQTNILALNAAVEAARAGEAGMGFAVVADEVRNLAQRCAQAAKDTADLIEDSITKSNDGKTKVDQVAVAFRAIAEQTGQVKVLVDEVKLGSEEQARGIEQVGKAIIQMEQVTQKTAAGAEESASAAEELTAQSESMREVVGRLTAMVDGGHGQNEHASSSRQSHAVSMHPKIAPTPPRRPQSSSSLTALSRAVAHKTIAKVAQPVAAGGRMDKNAIPMDGDFEEF